MTRIHLFILDNFINKYYYKNPIAPFLYRVPIKELIVTHREAFSAFVQGLLNEHAIAILLGQDVCTTRYMNTLNPPLRRLANSPYCMTVDDARRAVTSFTLSGLKRPITEREQQLLAQLFAHPDYAVGRSQYCANVEHRQDRAEGKKEARKRRK